MGDDYTFTAKGNASVGAQIGRASGDVSIHQSSHESTSADANLEALLDRVRIELKLADERRALPPGRVTTAQAMLEEIDTLVQSTEEPAPTHRSRLASALAKLQGAVTGATGLSNAVAALIRSIENFT